MNSSENDRGTACFVTLTINHQHLRFPKAAKYSSYLQIYLKLYDQLQSHAFYPPPIWLLLGQKHSVLSPSNLMNP